MNIRKFMTLPCALTLAFLLALLPSVSHAVAGKHKVDKSFSWKNPIMTATSDIVSIKEVKFYPDSTRVDFHVKMNPGFWFRFAKSTCAVVGDDKYPVIGTSNLELGQKTFLPESGVYEFSMTFKALPEGTESFSIIEDTPRGYEFNYIRDTEFVPSRIADTYWRDDLTGDLLIGFADSIVFYDSKAWRMTDMKEKKGKWHIKMEKGGSCHSVDMDKLSGRVRKVRIDGGKPIAASYIGGITMPDYPADNSGAGLTDTGYAEGDSVKISGWVRNGLVNQKIDRVIVSVMNLLTDDEEKYDAKIDPDGFFRLSFPVLNTSNVILKFMENGFEDFVFEPGEYFIIKDMKTGKTIVTGENSSLVNELLTHRVPPMGHKRYDLVDPVDDKAAAELLEYYRGEREKAYRLADETVAAHPGLSKKYRDFRRGITDAELGHFMVMHKFRSPDRKLPKFYCQYLDSLLKGVPVPFTAYRYYPYFAYNYLDQPERQNFSMLDIVKNSALDVRDRYCRLDREGKISLTPADRETIDRYVELSADIYEILKEAKKRDDMSEAEDAAVEKYNADPVHEAMDAIYERFKEQVDLYEADKDIRLPMETADSIGCGSPLRDFYLTYVIHKMQNSRQQPLDSAVLALARHEILLPAAINFVERENNKYVALANADYSKLKSIRMSPVDADQTDGEKIFRSLMEPHKGKIVLIDVWGTWCAPCRAALENSAEEFERLAPYDIVYMYLANNSEDKGWKSAILKYGLEGDNIVHYNLPSDQQRALETFLNVHSYPSYRLVDRDGDLLDLDVDARNLPALEELLRKL